MIVIYRNTYAVAVVLGDGRGIELVELLLEAEGARLLAHLAAAAGGRGVGAARHAAREREAARRRRRVRQVVEEDLRLARLAAKGNMCTWIQPVTNYSTCVHGSNVKHCPHWSIPSQPENGFKFISISPSGRISADGGPAAVRCRRRRHRRPLPDPAAAAARPGLRVATGGLAARRAPLASRSRPGKDCQLPRYLASAMLHCQRTPVGLQKSPTNGRGGARVVQYCFPMTPGSS